MPNSKAKKEKKETIDRNGKSFFFSKEGVSIKAKNIEEAKKKLEARNRIKPIAEKKIKEDEVEKSDKK